MSNEKLIVQLSRPERKYAKVYHDFLRCGLLTSEEKLVFIVLKSFLDFSVECGEVYPTVETICELTSMSRPRVTRTINSLIKKGIVKKNRRGLNKPNLYILSDTEDLWASKDLEELKVKAESDQKIMTLEDHIEAIKRMGYKVEIEKEPSSKARPGKDESSNNNTYNNVCRYDNVDSDNCQYSLGHMRALYGYAAMIHDNPELSDDVDIVMDILIDTLNSQRSKIKIAGELRPVETVKGKFLKLTKEEIMWSIRKFNEVQEPIKNVKGYLLTLLYGSKEQMALEITNQINSHGI